MTKKQLNNEYIRVVDFLIKNFPRCDVMGVWLENSDKMIFFSEN